MAIELKPGDTIKRTELHEQYGGRRQGGISPSRVTDNVLIFTDPTVGIRHGYLYDGPRPDGFYHYTGEGQFGDQRITQGNRTIRDHVEEGRELHLFEVADGQATYVGEFKYVDHYLADAPESGDGPIRSVIVFRLRPTRAQPVEPRPTKIDLLGVERVREVPVEQHLTERMMIQPNIEPREAERREQRLVQEYHLHLRASGHEVCRLQFRPEGEPAALFCDLYDKDTNTLIEAKGSVSRPAFRMAIGQLADYARLVEPAPQKVILVEQEPRPDLLDLARSQNIDVIWPTDGSNWPVLPG